jgi:Asp-tRNA(Asn)/Glu-tRNA(Gln) amidotransferase A subunit family amidase
MPVGVGIMADRFCDELLLDFAEKLEEFKGSEK